MNIKVNIKDVNRKDKSSGIERFPCLPVFRCFFAVSEKSPLMFRI